MSKTRSAYPNFHDHLHYYYHCQGHVHTVAILAKVVKVKPVGGIPSAAMAFNFGQCINCEREWSSEGHKAEQWYKVQDWEVVRWVCYRCTDKLWKCQNFYVELRGVLCGHARAVYALEVVAAQRGQTTELLNISWMEGGRAASVPTLVEPEETENAVL